MRRCACALPIVGVSAPHGRGQAHFAKHPKTIFSNQTSPKKIPERLARYLSAVEMQCFRNCTLSSVLLTRGVAKKAKKRKKERKETPRFDKSRMCRDHPHRATSTKVVMWGGVPDVVNHAKFHQNWFRGFGPLGGRNPPFSYA